MITPECLVVSAVFADNCGHRFVLREFSVSYRVGGDGVRRPTGTATLETIPADGEPPRLIEIAIDGPAVLTMVEGAPVAVTAERAPPNNGHGA